MEENKFQTPDMMARCVPMVSLQAVLGGKWKILILWYLAVYGEVPPRVEYSLTEMGWSFTPVLNQMLAWSAGHLCPDFVNPYGEQALPASPAEDSSVR